MLKARKRITKRQIKEDKFVTFYFKAQDYIKQNLNKVLIGLGAVLAVILITTLILQSKRTAELNASVKLAEANSKLMRGEMQPAIDILLNMIEDYSGTQSAARGIYLLAYSYYQKGEFENAEKYFRRYLDDYGDDPIQASAAYSGLAASLEQQKKFQDAAQFYEKAAAKFSNHFNAPQQLMDAARCYKLVNRANDARRCYEKLIEKYPNSALKNEAEAFLAVLKG